MASSDSYFLEHLRGDRGWGQGGLLSGTTETTKPKILELEHGSYQEYHQ